MTQEYTVTDEEWEALDLAGRYQWVKNHPLIPQEEKDKLKAELLAWVDPILEESERREKEKRHQEEVNKLLEYVTRNAAVGASPEALVEVGRILAARGQKT